jgi:hypothetical protein
LSVAKNSSSAFDKSSSKEMVFVVIGYFLSAMEENDEA